MSEAPSPQIKAEHKINIVSYATNLPGLLIWIAVLARILIKNAKLWGLVLICCIMIVF
jgi:hypothetical protein